MALLFMEGWDHLGGSTGPLDTKWAAGGSGSVIGGSARTGLNGFYGSTSGRITKPLPASGGFAVGAAFRVTGSTTWGNQDLFQLREGTTIHLTLSTDGNNHLAVRRGGTVLQAGTTVLVPNNWYFFEFKGVIHATTGSYAVRIDAVPEAALTVSGVNTRNGGTTGQWDRLGLYASVELDDLYLCDLSGAAPQNDWLGPVKIETLLPLFDAQAAGSNAGLTPSQGTDHGGLVRESTPDATTYNGSATIGAKDTYRFPALVLQGTIFGIQTNLYTAKSDTGTRTVCHVVRAGGVDGADYDGPNIAPTTGFGFTSRVWSVNPTTGLAWTPAEIAALEAGMKITG